MDELEKLKNAWDYDSYDTQSLDNLTPSFNFGDATPAPEYKSYGSLSYDNNPELGSISAKNEGLHGMDIEASLEKIRNLQSGEITPSQAWATGLMGLVPGLLGYAIDGNQGAAQGFDIGSKVVGGYTDNIQKNNLQQAQLEKELVKDAINEKQWQRRTDYQNTLQTTRQDNYFKKQKELLDWKGDEGYIRDYNDPNQSTGRGGGRPTLSPETNIELQNAIATGEATPELRTRIISEVGAYGAKEIFNNTGLTIKRPEKAYADVQSSTMAGLKAIDELDKLAQELGSGVTGGVSNILNSKFDKTSAAAQFQSRANVLAKQIAVALEPGGRVSDKDMQVIQEALVPSYLTGGEDTARQNLAYFRSKILTAGKEQLKAAGGTGRNIRGLEEYTDNGQFLGAIEEESGSGVNELETAKSLAELDGQKVVDETVDRGVVNTMGKMKKQVNKRTGEVRYVPVN